MFGDDKRTLKVAVGLDYIALQQTDGSTSHVHCAGRFSNDTRPESLRMLPELDGFKLAALVAGAFHCCALTDEGSLYVFGAVLVAENI